MGKSANGNKVLTMRGIRELLCETLEGVRNNVSTAAQCNSISNGVGKYLQSVKIEIEYCKMTGQTPKIDLFLPPPAHKPEQKKN